VARASQLKLMIQKLSLGSNLAAIDRSGNESQRGGSKISTRYTLGV
jgi:hypothetical protein